MEEQDFMATILEKIALSLHLKGCTQTFKRIQSSPALTAQNAELLFDVYTSILRMWARA